MLHVTRILKKVFWATSAGILSWSGEAHRFAFAKNIGDAGATSQSITL